jgi:hypothetical protein
MQSTQPDSEGEFSFNDRYGVRPTTRWRLPAIVLGITGLLWIFWAGLNSANPEFRIQVISFSVTGEKEISLRYGITRADAGATTICTLVAKDIDKNIVGQIDETIEPGAAYVELLTPIPARSAPVTASVLRCRLG